MKYTTKDYIKKYEELNNLDYSEFANYTSFENYITSIFNKDESLELPTSQDLENVYATYFETYEEINKHNIRLLIARLEKNNEIDVIDATLQNQLDFRTYQLLSESATNTNFIVPSIETLLDLVPNIESTNLLNQNKTEKTTELNNWFSEQIETGFDTGLGYNLAIDKEDREAFAQQLVLLKTAEELGNAIPDQTIKDTQENLHTVSYLVLKQLIVGLGMTYQALWTNYNTIKNSINDASTQEELDLISIPEL